MKPILAVALMLAACAGATAKPVAYEADLEACLQHAKTCAEYLECRRGVARNYGREFKGSCADGGAE